MENKVKSKKNSKKVEETSNKNEEINLTKKVKEVDKEDKKKKKVLEEEQVEEEKVSNNSSFSDIELEGEDKEEEIDPESKDNQELENKSKDKPKENYFSKMKFTDLSLSKETLQALEENNFVNCTEIQEKCIPVCLTGADIMGAAKTGSGKSLSFLIPAVELLAAAKFKQVNGTGVLILTPTRELALQLFNLAKDLLAYHKKTCALIMGGANRKMEAERLKKGVNLVVATPGRLLDHLKSTKGFNYSMLSMLIIDEADAILKIGKFNIF